MSIVFIVRCRNHGVLCILGAMALCTLWASEVEREPSTISAAIDPSLQAFGHARAKTIQAQAVQATLQGRDVFVSVPTGYGKSLIFQMLPFCASFILERLGKAAAGVPSVLVVSPLLTLGCGLLGTWLADEEAFRLVAMGQARSGIFFGPRRTGPTNTKDRTVRIIA